MSEGLLVVGLSVAFFVFLILIAPWAAFLIEKYWSWCFDRQKR
jgi:hypothetical protein